MKIRTRCHDCGNVVVETVETTLDDIRANWDNFVINVAPSQKCKRCNNPSPSAIFNVDFFIVDDEGVEHPCSEYIQSKIDVDALISKLAGMSFAQAESLLKDEPIDVVAEDVTEKGGDE